MKIIANWIWSDDSDGRAYNLCSAFRRDFRLDAPPVSAILAIAADTTYRLKVNGQWIGDGPARSYPDHFRYDRYDLTGLLQAGGNRIEATVRYFGCGTFHHVPQRAGFLAQLELQDPSGGEMILITDDQWKAAPVPQWIERTPKNSIQQGPYEIFDASRTESPAWRQATVIASADDAPWRNLAPRDCRMLTRRESLLNRVIGIRRVAPQLRTIAVPLHQLFFPGDVSTNWSDTFPLLLALEVTSPCSQVVRLSCDAFVISVNGHPALNGEVTFREGKNLLVAGVQPGGHRCIAEIGFPAGAALTVANFYDHTERPAAILFPQWAALCEDIPQPWANSELREREKAFVEERDRALAIRTAEEFRERYPAPRLLEKQDLVDDSAHLSFESRRPEPAEPGDVENPDFLVYADDVCAVVHPVPEHDIELCCDLGEQNIGYWNFGIFAPAGTVIDIAAVEYITPDGRLQHTHSSYRNSMRYICHEGYNRYTSMERRSGRYLFLTVRNAPGPVRIQFLRLVESTYPVIAEGEFRSSDPSLNRIFEISRRTLKLCMEDTFTDCPLYEQTLWVGDARNEGLFAMSVFGAYDLVRRCIRLAGESLQYYPLVSSQVPSGWGCIIPVWSFLWGLSVWDYYFETGDLDFVREIWPMVVRNLEGAEQRIDPETGLFSMEAWNLFDWSKTSTERPILLYNTFFLIAALDAAAKLGDALGETEKAGHCRKVRNNLADAANRVWDSRKLAWPDSVGPDGPSENIAVHTSMLAILYDAVSEEHLASARANTVTPRSELIKVASPFASLYLYEALEKLGLVDEILRLIRRDYLPMVELGSSTVWETYPNAHSGAAMSSFPSRSHCHGWSAAPLYFLPRLVLGIIPETVGGTRVAISPHLSGLESASGARKVAAGRIEVSWRLEKEKLIISATAPAGVELVYRFNSTHTDCNVIFNGEAVR